MATKITTALVAALVVGALMTPNHEALARGGGGFGGGGSMEVVSAAEASTEVVSTKERFLMACNDAVAPEVFVYAAPHQLAIM